MRAFLAGVRSRPVRLAAIAAGSALLCVAAISLTRQGNLTASFWPLDALAVAFLLHARAVAASRAALAAVAAGNVAANLFEGHSLTVALAFCTCNAVEIGLAAWWLRPLGRAPDLLAWRAARPFAAAVASGPALGAVFLVAVAGFPLQTAPVWFAAHALALAIVTPVALDVLRGRVRATLRAAFRRADHRLHVLALLGTVAIVFVQNRYPLLFLIALPLGANGVRLGPAATTTVVLPLALVASVSTMSGHGPFALNPRIGGDERILLAQLFVLAAALAFRHIAELGRGRVVADAAREAERVRLAASEARYRLLADNALDVVSRFDAAGRCVYVSPAALPLFGVAPEALTGPAPPDILHAEDWDAFAAVHRSVRAGLVDHDRHGFRIVRPDGTVVAVEASLRLVRDPATGAPDGVVSITRDVSERARLEAERSRRERDLALANLQLERLMRTLAEARDEAEAASRAKSRFLAATSHELRTPLNGLLGHSELLRLEGGLSPAQAARVDAMMDAGSHLLSMINAILDLSAIEADRVACDASIVDPGEVAASCLALLRPGADAKGLRLRLDVASAGPVRVLADPTRLRQVVLNLLGNAIKFTDAGEVVARVRPDAEGWIRIDIADTGPGIRADRRARLFREFDRLDVETRMAVEGTGLGLSLSARLASLMGGTLAHADNPGGGSVFSLVLPAAPAPAGAADRPAAARPGAGVGIEPADPPLRVLVVDDVAMNREIACALLASVGHLPVPCAGGAAALATLQSDAIDVVLMDASMPGLDGLETTRRLRALDHPCRDVPVIALTAYVFAEQVEACRRAGMDLHLAKPVTRAALLAALRAVRAGAPSAQSPAASVCGKPDDDADLAAVFDRAAFDGMATLLPSDAVASCLDVLRERCGALLGALGRSDGADGNGLRAAAHELAGSAGTFGFARLTAAARRFEQGGAGEPGAGDALARALRATLAAFPAPDGDAAGASQAREAIPH